LRKILFVPLFLLLITTPAQAVPGGDRPAEESIPACFKNTTIVGLMIAGVRFPVNMNVESAAPGTFPVNQTVVTPYTCTFTNFFERFITGDQSLNVLTNDNNNCREYSLISASIEDNVLVMRQPPVMGETHIQYTCKVRAVFRNNVTGNYSGVLYGVSDNTTLKGWLEEYIDRLLRAH